MIAAMEKNRPVGRYRHTLCENVAEVHLCVMIPKRGRECKQKDRPPAIRQKDRPMELSLLISVPLVIVLIASIFLSLQYFTMRKKSL